MDSQPDILVRVEYINPANQGTFLASVERFFGVQVPAFVAAIQDADPAPARLISIGPGDV